MPEIFRIAYSAGLGFTLGVIVMISVYLVIYKLLSRLYDAAVKSIGKKSPKITAKPEKKEAPKEEPQSFTDNSLVSNILREMLSKDLLLGPFVFHPIHSISELTPETKDSEFSVIYRTDKGSYATLTLKLNLVELESLKQ